jgi:hypothetical protein
MRKLLATISALSCVALAQGFGLECVDLGQVGSGTRAYDIVVSLASDPNYGEEDWISCEVTATLSGCGTFVDAETYNPPPAWIGIGDPWDSFFTSPEFYPNADGFGSVSFADPAQVIEEPQLRWAEWYDVVDTGAGTFVLQRLNVACDEPCTEDCWLSIDMTCSSSWESPLMVFEWDILVCAAPPPCPGDLDGDEDVDLADLAQLLGNYGITGGASYEDGDLDGDGDVDLSDLSALLAVYGTSC